MAVFKCKMCGATLNIEEAVSVVSCEYCGTKQTVSVSDDEKRVNLYNRANRLRLANEFDKAATLYESIVAEFPEEAEAYWGIVLCDYGIEYVDDPATALKIPTCHRASFDSVLTDENYQMALENADVSAQKVYRDQARELERIRTEILAISQNETPYDIFICYKETDQKGERTIDSVIAQNVYEALSEKGYKVFFSRISLEDKLGQQYEPFIFAALNSAKIMLAFGTQYEHYHAVWVKNEWNRFLKLMARDKTKMLIPCYKDIDAYDMPEEFKPLQAQDMGKVGAMQDLLRGIDKILPLQPKTVAETEPLLRRLFMLLEDGDFNTAQSYCERILDMDPECGKAYLGKLMIEYGIRNIHEFANCTQSPTYNANYQKVLKYADRDTVAIVKQYVEECQEKLRYQTLETNYQKAKNVKENAKTKQDLEFALGVFTAISYYKDCAQLKEECLQNLNNLEHRIEYRNALALVHHATNRTDIEKALEIFTKIPNYKESPRYIQEICPNCQIIFGLLEQFKTIFQQWLLAKGDILHQLWAQLQANSSPMPYEGNPIVTENPEFYALHQKMVVLIQEIDTIRDQYNGIVNSKNFIAFQEEKAKVLLLEDLLSATKDNRLIFGKYMGEPIEWTILKVENSKCLLISSKCLEMCTYAEYCDFLEWHKSPMRKFLNNTFLQKAFTKSEATLIAETKIDAMASDKVFILTQAEIETYFPTEEHRECPLTYHLQRSLPFDKQKNRWWMRTEGTGNRTLIYVDSQGVIHPEGDIVSARYNTVRPAIWIDFSD